MSHIPTRKQCARLARIIPPVTVPCGRSGSWGVDRFTVTELQARQWNEGQVAFMAGGHVAFVEPVPAIASGTYTRLRRGSATVMTDTYGELADHLAFVEAAHGDVLISGLGLGAVLQAVLLKPAVTRATVIERSPDVIALVAPHYRSIFGERFHLIEGDALTYEPPADAHYGAVWHDIWDDVDPANLSQIEQLEARYAALTDWQDSWTHKDCDRLIAQGWTPAMLRIFVG